MNESGGRPSFWRVALLAVMLSVLVLAALLMAALSHLDPMPVHIMINGVEMHEVLSLDALAPGHQLVLVLTLAAVLLFGLLLLPALLLLLVLFIALPVGLVIGIPVLVLAVLAAVLLAPLGLLVWVLRRLMRSTPPAPTSTTMAT